MAGITLFVFALTPRAGARHQVYLVSRDDRDDPGLKRRIEQLVPEINRTVASAQQPVVAGPDFIVAWHMVRQPTTGRMAPEWICVAADSSTAELKPSEEGQNWLQTKLKELDQIVSHRPWGESGPIFEQLPEMKSWQEEVEESELFQVHSGDARPEAQPQLQQTQKRRLPRWLLLFLLVACLLPVVALGFSEEFSRLIGKIKGTIFGPQKTSWQQLAKAVGAQNPTPQEILEKLQLLFEPDRSAAAVAPAEPPEPKIEELLQAFEKAMGRSGKENLQTLSQSPKLLEELQKLFPQGEFDPMGLVLVEGLPPKTAQFWRSLLPPVFDKLQNSLAQAAKSPDLWQLPKISNELLDAVGLKEQMPCYVKIFKVLADYTPSQGPNHPEQMGPQRRFYVPSQQDSLEKVHRVLTSICQACRELKKQELKTSSASSGTSQEEAPCEDNVKDCLKTIVATLQERLPGAIENTNKVPDPDEKNLVKLRQALETLQKLVNEWKEVDKCR